MMKNTLNDCLKVEKMFFFFNNSNDEEYNTNFLSLCSYIIFLYDVQSRLSLLFFEKDLFQVSLTS
jgi:hypothetical protein